MQKIILFFLLFSNLTVFSQGKQTEKILSEGKLLFRLEKGSWYGSDDMLERFKTKKDSVGGYLSYEASDSKIKTIFFSRYNSEKVLIRYEFDSLPQPKPITIDTINHTATKLEKNLIAIRQDAKDKAYSLVDNFFSFYEKTSFNFIPVIKDHERNVFILTGPQVSGFVLIGNDYKLTYNKKNEFVKKEKIHNSILQFPYTSKDKENPTVSSMHSHILTKYISSTDICTLYFTKILLNGSNIL